MSKHIATEKVILISSTKNQREIPSYFQMQKCWSAASILYETNAKFMTLAFHQVVTWKNELIPPNVFHIHGESDRIFPYRYVREDFSVSRGGHFMIMNRAEYISSLIQRIIELNSEAEPTD